MSYQVLARTWRPQRFADLIGQEAVVRTLQNALAAGTVGHAYLFSGLRGVGKTTVARLLAKAMNCERGPTAEPCGECLSCREVTAGSSLDVVELDAATHTGVDDVRELQDLLRYRPTRDRFRVIIVDEVHMLSRSAFNALLKSLEEPPPYILWIFATTERHKVPATILSRCQQLEFRPVSTALIVSRLRQVAEREGVTMTAAAAGMIARAAEGSVRDALSLLDQLRAFAEDAIDEEAVAAMLGVPRLEQVTRLIEVLAAGRSADGLAVLREELAAGHDCTALYRETGRVLRTLLHMALDPELSSDLPDDQQQSLRAVAAAIGATPLGRMLALWVEQESLLRDASNRELALEVAALRLSRWPAVQRLEALLGGSDAVPVASSTPSAAPPSTPPAAGGGELVPPPTPPTEELRGVPAGTAEAVVCRAAGAVEVDREAVAQRDVEALASGDPQLALVCRILGGEIVTVRPDGEG